MPVRLQNMHRLIWTFLTLLTLNLDSGTGLECVKCEGSSDCMHGTCEGDYCMMSTFRPKLMSSNFGKKRHIKGCVTGSLMRKNIPSHCETYLEDETLVTTCFCNDNNFCNRNIKKTKKERINLVVCRCSGDAMGCNDFRECLGEYCTLLRNTDSGAVISRGCINSSLPLVERRGAGACMQPPITAPIHHLKSKKKGINQAELAKMESCMCSEDRCNENPPQPQSLNPKVMECKIDMTINANGISMEAGILEKATCRGEYCYDIDLSNNQDQTSNFIEYQVKGCMTFGPEAKLAEELNPTGCMSFGSTHFQLDACYRTAEGATLPPNQRSNETPKKAPQLPVHQPKPNPQEQSAEPKSEERPKTKFSPKAKFPGEKEIPVRPSPDFSEDSETNTTIVVVFVVIMILIVIAGVVWKFEIHKKLFRARYESVAG